MKAGRARRPEPSARQSYLTLNRASKDLRSLLYSFGMWLGERRPNVSQPRLSAHNVGAVFMNTPDI
jgi:hypothetical protein